MTRTIALVVGSLRKESFTRKVATAITKLAPKLAFVPIEIGNLPLFNQDLEATPPPEWVALRDQIRPVDGVLFATPEYNRSVPGVLKNAIDIASRPYGKSVWARKPAGVLSVSPGSIGGFGAHHHLRQMLAYLDMPTLAQPEMYIGNVTTLFDEAGEFVPETRDLLAKFAAAFTSWVAHHANAGAHAKA